MAAHVVHIDQAPEMEGTFRRPGGARSTVDPRKTTRNLGNLEDPSRPPYAFYIRRPAGDVTHEHRHGANRIEFLIEGEIEWRERGKPPMVYGAGTLTYVEAGTFYGYTVLKDATILILFEAPPGMNYA